MPAKVTIPIGARFGRLTILGESPQRSGSFVAWGCRCDCGMIVIVAGVNLRSGHTLSCGCLLADRNREIRTTHGLTKTIPEYSNWCAMRARCLQPNTPQYRNYGGRGITICPEWNDFESFYRAMGPKPSPRHTLDRIDNDGPYSPENCRWATPLQQSRNRRYAHMLSYLGHTKRLSEWAEITGLRPLVINHRLARGWTVERALTTPLTKASNPTTSRDRQLTCHGRTLSVREWAEILGIPVNTLTERLRRGWSEERTVATPLMWRAGT